MDFSGRANGEAEGETNPWDWTHRWTLSRHLWEADSPFEFARAWREKPHFIIKNFSLEYFLENGTCDDVDEFAELMLTA